MTSCSKCANRRDCWIRSTVRGDRFPTDPRDVDLAIKASTGNCELFYDEEDCE